MDNCGLSNLQKVEMIMQYVNRSQYHIWQSLLGYANCNWDDFYDDLCKEYINPSAKSQFSRQKLVEFANKYAQRHMNDKTNIINYYCQFNNNNHGKVLVKSGRVTKRERNTTFWHGFHPDNQKYYTNALSLNTLTNQEDKCLTSKMFLQLQELSSQVTMTSSYRSHPFNTVNLPTLKNKGQSTAHVTSKSLTTMNMLPGVDVPVAPPPLIIKDWKTKMHHLATKKNTQVELTDTHHYMSKLEWSNSKAPLMKTRTRSWTS